LDDWKGRQIRIGEQMSKKISVLIVDDSRSAIAQLEAMLGEFVKVDVVGAARDGAGAIRMVADLEPELVLMDIVMPGMDGLAALRLMASSHPNVQIAMLSSVGGRASMAAEAFRLGAIQVLGKPIEREALRGLLDGFKRDGE
jgi:chemotaxis response regulator CheB